MVSNSRTSESKWGQGNEPVVARTKSHNILNFLETVRKNQYKPSCIQNELCLGGRQGLYKKGLFPVNAAVLYSPSITENC